MEEYAEVLWKGNDTLKKSMLCSSRESLLVLFCGRTDNGAARSLELSRVRVLLSEDAIHTPFSRDSVESRGELLVV
jgi:hypothetical protein